jgi:hypothetical protein
MRVARDPHAVVFPQELGICSVNRRLARLGFGVATEGTSLRSGRLPEDGNVAHCVAHDHALELGLRFTKADAWVRSP